MSLRLVLGPRDNLVRAVADHMPAGSRDLSNVAVVFPGKRPAHFLRRELARRTGSSFVPPRMFSIDEFVQFLITQFHQEQVRDLDAIDAVSILYDVHTHLVERLGGDAFRSLDAFLPIGFKLFGELEELQLAGLTNRRIQEALEGIAYDYRHTLGKYYEAFYARVVELGRSTRAMRYAEAADRIGECSLQGFQRIIVAGLHSMTAAERRIVDDLDRRDEVVLLFQTDKLQEGDPEPAITVTAAPDVHGQVFALAALLRRHLDDPAAIDDRTVIVLPTVDALFPLVEHVLAGLPEDRFNIACGYPLSRTPIAGFINTLFELLRSRQSGGYAAHSYVSFILHPYTKNVRFAGGTESTRMLMHGLEEMLTDDRSKLHVTLEELEHSDEIFTRIAFAAGEGVTPDEVREHLRQIHDKTVRALESAATVGTVAEAVMDILAFISDNTTAPLHPLFRPYAETVLETFARVRSSLLASKGFENVDGIHAFVRHVMERTEVPFPGTPLRGLQVLGVLETRGLQFDRVFMLELTDDVLPGSIGSDMLLPQQVREKLGLETVRDRDELAEHHFRILLGGSANVDLFYSEAGHSVRSRFVERVLWEREQQAGLRGTSAAVRTVEYRLQLSSSAPQAIPKTPDALSVVHGMAISPTAVDTYIRCPLRFYYRYVLRMSEREEAAEDIDARELGTFVHGVLKEYFEPFVGHALTPRALASSSIGDVVESKFRERYGAEPAASLLLLKRQVLRRLEALIDGYQKPLCERVPVRIVSLETSLTASVFGCRITGKIDRVEERGMETVVIDYKTGAEGARTQIRFTTLDPDDPSTYRRAIGSIQLPFYMLLFSEAQSVPPERLVPGYLFLGERMMNADSEVLMGKEPGERIQQYRKLRSVIERLLGEINDPGIAFHPTADLAAECPRCPFTAICGTQWAG